MAITLSIIGIAFAAICVWLTVRVVNRRERWAKWTLAITVAMPVLYMLSLGPLIWLGARGVMYSGYGDHLRIYGTPARVAHDYGPEPVRRALRWYEVTAESFL